MMQVTAHRVFVDDLDLFEILQGRAGKKVADLGIFDALVIPLDSGCIDLAAVVEGSPFDHFKRIAHEIFGHIPFVGNTGDGTAFEIEIEQALGGGTEGVRGQIHDVAMRVEGNRVRPHAKTEFAATGGMFFAGLGFAGQAKGSGASKRPSGTSQEFTPGKVALRKMHCSGHHTTPYGLTSASRQLL